MGITDCFYLSLAHGRNWQKTGIGRLREQRPQNRQHRIWRLHFKKERGDQCRESAATQDLQGQRAGSPTDMMPHHPW